MSRLAVSVRLDTRSGTAILRPTLQAAFALVSEFASFSPILKGIAEGNVSVLTRLFGACGFLDAGADLFNVPGRSLASRIVELRPIAGELVLALMGADPEAKEERKPAAGNGKPFDLVGHYETMFGFATGVLRWTPEASWEATPGEIIAAMEARAEANMTPDERRKRDREAAMAKLPVADRARMALSAFGTRTEADAG